MSQRMRIDARLTMVWCLLAASGWAACGTLSRPPVPTVEVTGQVAWQPEEMRQHLRFFNGSGAAARGGATEAAIDAAYVAARMKEFGLQPALGSAYVFEHRAPLNVPVEAQLLAGGLDTLIYGLGVDFVPDGLSDAGNVELRELAYEPETGQQWYEGRGALVPARLATRAHLARLREAGAEVAVIAGPLSMNLAAAPVEGLVVVRVTPVALAEMLATRPEELVDRLARDNLVVWQLGRPLRVRVTTVFRPSAEIFNVLGYVPGKHPARARELVVVCADLDALRTFAGVDVTHLENFGTGATALLEVARNYGALARRWPMPARTVLFAVWTGGAGAAGLRAYLRNPVWALDETVGVVSVGLDAAEDSTVAALLEAHDVPFYPVAPQAVPDSLMQVVVGGSGIDRLLARSAAPSPSQMLEWAVSAATRMGEAVHRLLLREAVTPAPMVPVAGDTLRVPVVLIE